MLVGTFYYYVVISMDQDVQETEVTCLKVGILIGIKVYAQALAGVLEIWTLSMGYFSNPDISDI